MRGGVRPRVPSEGGIHRRGLPGLFPQRVAAATWGLGTGGRVGDGAPCCPVETPRTSLWSRMVPESAHEPSALSGSPTAPVTRLRPVRPEHGPPGSFPRGTAQPRELPASCGQNRAVVLARRRRKPEAGPLLCRGKGQQVASGSKSLPSGSLPRPRRGPAASCLPKGSARSLGPGTDVPPVGDSCQSHSTEFCY